MGALKIYSINVSALSRISTRAKKKIISQQEPIGSCFTGNQTAVCNKFNVCISVCDYFPFFFNFILKGLAELTLPFVGQMGLSIFSWGLDTTATMKHVTE